VNEEYPGAQEFRAPYPPPLQSPGEGGGVNLTPTNERESPPPPPSNLF